MEKLIKTSESQTLMAYQIAFDLYENASQQFLAGICKVLKALAPIPLEEPVRQGDVQPQTEDKPETTARYDIDGCNYCYWFLLFTEPC